MKKKIGLLAAAVAGVAMAGSVSAATINFGGYQGPIEIKYDNLDVGRIYPTGSYGSEAALDAVTPVDDPTTPLVDESLLPGSDDAAEDFWGIAQVKTIFEDGVGAGNTDLIYARTGAAGSLQITAIFWGGIDIAAEVDASGAQDTYSRNIKIAFYASVIGDNSDGIDIDFSTAVPETRTAAVGGIPQYAGITDGTLIFTFNGIAGEFAGAPHLQPLAEFFSAVTPVTTGGFTGDGTMYAEVGAIGANVGVQNSQIQSLPGPDASIKFTVDPPPAGTNWLVSSDDPLIASVVPTPSVAAMGLVGLGSLLAGRARRRK